MADDLRRYIRQGDLDALLDPTLPLLLVADGPTVQWWQEGAAFCAERICVELAAPLRRPDCVVVVEAWARAHGTRDSKRLATGLRLIANTEVFGLDEALAAVLGAEPVRVPHLLPVVLDLARRLRARRLLTPPPVPEDLTTALRVLERYGCG